jgi:Uncharacterised nucleotidyltransferase
VRLTPEWLATLPPEIARRPPLGPLRWWAYSQANRLGELPDAGDLRRKFLRTVADNTVRLARAAEVLDVAAAAGITLLPLKGALLAGAAYPDAGLRPMADLDLAVHPAQLDAAVAALASLGFRRQFPDRPRFRAPFAHDIALTDGRHIVELHHRWLHELGVAADTTPLFARAIELELLGRRRLVPSWADTLVIVATHAAGHVFGEHPLWLVDVALVVARGGDGVVERAGELARACRAERAFAVAMTIAARALPRDVPLPPLSPRGRRRARWLAPLLWPTLARTPSQPVSLAARALMTDRPTAAAASLWAKVGVTIDEWRHGPPTR